MTTDKRYPECSKLGLLRALNGGEIVVGSQALYEHLGNTKYQLAIRSLKHDGGGWSADSVERFLQESK